MTEVSAVRLSSICQPLARRQGFVPVRHRRPASNGGMPDADAGPMTEAYARPDATVSRRGTAAL
jgi:hypothetical protein